MACFENDPLHLRLTTMLDSLCSRVEDTISLQENKVEECKLMVEMATRFKEEIKLNESLCARLAETQQRAARLARACGPGGAGAGAGQGARAPALSAGDQARLQKAKEMYQIAKELTGIRWDFSAPPDVAKGYVRSETRKLLEPFELRCEPAGCAVGPAVCAAGTAGPAATKGSGEGPGAGAAVGEPEATLWARLSADKENRSPL